MLKNMRLVILFDLFLNPSIKFTRSLANIVFKLQHVLKEVCISENFLSEQLYTIDFYILKRSIISHNNKSLQKSLYTQEKNLSSLTRGCTLPIFTANETVTNLTQYELFQEESDLLTVGLYFSIQPDKI